MMIEVTAEDIEIGSPWCRGGLPCPIEIALTRAFGKKMRAGRGTFAPAGPGQVTRSLPYEAQDWSKQFDWSSNDKRIPRPGPFSFEVDG